MFLSWEQDPPTAAPGGPPPYRVAVTSIDRLLVRIFELSSRNPAFFTATPNSYAREALAHQNPVFDSLIKDRIPQEQDAK
jgi:hypothetical protein